MDEFVDNDAITRAFDRLRPKDRMILVLHHVEERPVAEIDGHSECPFTAIPPVEPSARLA